MRAARLFLPLLFAACAGSDPKDPAEAYERLRERYARGAGIELEGVLTAPGRSTELKFRAAPPASGSLEVRTTDEFLGDTETETQRWIGNGEAVYLLAGERRECVLTAGSWRQLEVLSQLDFLAPAWTKGQPPAAARVEWADASRTVLRLLDAAGAPLREYRLEKGLIREARGWDDAGEWNFRAARVDLRRDADAAGYAQALPADFTVLGTPYDEFNHLRNLLEPGEFAPEITLVNLDGTERTLSEFRGRRLLIAFWFYS